MNCFLISPAAEDTSEPIFSPRRMRVYLMRHSFMPRFEPIARRAIEIILWRERFFRTRPLLRDTKMPLAFFSKSANE